MGGVPLDMTRIICLTEYEVSGRWLACGDVNGDELDDILIGSPGNFPEYLHGKATLLYGMREFPDSIHLAYEPLNGIRFFPEPDPHEAAHLGDHVAIADINNDGNGDIILAAPGACPFGCRTCGAVYIIYGNDNLPDSIRMDSPNILMTRLLGKEDWGGYGQNLTTADLSADGYDDIVILNDNTYVSSKDRNEIIIVYGESLMPDSIFLASDTTVTRITGIPHDESFGYALSSVDQNGDGVNDLLIGNYGAYAKGRKGAGKVHLFYGIGDSIVDPNGSLIPKIFLRQNYPNPFSSNTVIEYSIPESATIVITFYNILGQRVRRIIKTNQSKGPHSIIWDGKDDKGKRVASGVYFYRFKVGTFSATKKVILLR